MKLSDIITANDDFHAITHRDERFPTPEQMKAKHKRLDHIFRAIDKCVRDCGATTPFPHEEAAVMCATVLMIDDVMEYLTEKRKAS